MKKYDFGIQYINPGNGCTETMTITGCDSFDEAIRLMEKAKKERDAQLKPVFVPPPVNVATPGTSGTPAQSANAPSTTANPGPANSSHQPA